MTRKISEMTPEEADAHRAKQRQLTPEQRERKRARDREREKTRVLTPEQRKRKQDKHRETETWQAAYRYYLRLLDRLRERGMSFPRSDAPS